VFTYSPAPSASPAVKYPLPVHGKGARGWGHIPRTGAYTCCIAGAAKTTKITKPKGATIAKSAKSR
jgi:hypothetical protein